MQWFKIIVTVSVNGFRFFFVSKNYYYISLNKDFQLYCGIGVKSSINRHFMLFASAVCKHFQVALGLRSPPSLTMQAFSTPSFVHFLTFFKLNAFKIFRLCIKNTSLISSLSSSFSVYKFGSPFGLQPVFLCII